MLWSTILTILLVCLVLWHLPSALWQYYRQCKAFRSIPGPPMHWLLGEKWTRNEEEREKRTKLIQEHRWKVYMWRWSGPLWPVLYVTHPEAIQEVIKIPKSRSMLEVFRPAIGDSILIAEGKKWFHNRRLLTPAFHFEILKGYIPIINSCLQVLVKKWSSASKECQCVLVLRDITKLSMDVIMCCAFNTKTNCQLADTHHPYCSAVLEILDLLTDRLDNPLHWYSPLYSLTANRRRLRREKKATEIFVDSVIRERKEIMNAALSKQDKCDRLHFIDILLTARDEHGKGFTDEEIRNEANLFMAAGHNTTTSAISWTLFCLAKCPEHQDKVREEVNAVLMGREQLEYGDLKELKYTTWCIKEAMRLYPPVRYVGRETKEDTVIAGHVIPGGVNVILDIIGLHRHPDVWEEPEEYNPLRFHPSQAEGRHPYAYMPFSAGYRNCIGQNFALNEMKIVIALLVKQFQFSLDESHKVIQQHDIVLVAKNDIKLSHVCIED